jgi:hypothetical protein
MGVHLTNTLTALNAYPKTRFYIFGKSAYCCYCPSYGCNDYFHYCGYLLCLMHSVWPANLMLYFIGLTIADE